MDNVHAHYVANKTRVIERGANDSWLMYSDRAVFKYNKDTGEYDFLYYDHASRLRLDETRLRLIKGALSCSA